MVHHVAVSGGATPWPPTPSHRPRMPWAPSQRPRCSWNGSTQCTQTPDRGARSAPRQKMCFGEAQVVRTGDTSSCFILTASGLAHFMTLGKKRWKSSVIPCVVTNPRVLLRRCFDTHATPRCPTSRVRIPVIPTCGIRVLGWRPCSHPPDRLMSCHPWPGAFLDDPRPRTRYHLKA